MKAKRLWGERLDTEVPSHVIDFLSGRDVRGLPPCDQILIPYDIWGSKAHSIMLWKQKIISESDCRKILKGLREIESLSQRGLFVLDVESEDVHSNIETELIARFGVESVGKMHTGRSRNDQIALDMRLYLRDQAVGFVDSLVRLVETMAVRAKGHLRTVMPGFTHYQPAMITSFGHLVMGLAMPLERDLIRFINWHRLFNLNPLGGAAGYGTTFPLDRQLTSRLLAFDGPQVHSTDPVTNRWEPETELAFAIAMVMNHLSIVAQTFILLSTTEFGMIRLDDAHCDGSSIMPQKRNPGSLEVIKAKSAVAQGILTALLSMGRATMVGYNKDSQWTKYLIMDLVSECTPAIAMMSEIIELMGVNEAIMENQARRSFITATHLLESIVQHSSLPLREAKGLVEKAVRRAEKAGKEEVEILDLNQAAGEMGLELAFRQDDIAGWQDPTKILSKETIVGSPGPSATKKSISRLNARLRKYRAWSSEQAHRVHASREEIASIEKSLGI